MKWLTLPTGEGKPSWGALFGVVSALYIFVDPYQRDASAIEWFWTSMTFVLFLTLCGIAAIFWSKTRVVMLVCGATTLLAVAFTMYRPSGVILFTYVAAFAPFAVNGNVVRASVMVIAAAAVGHATWWLRWPPSNFPVVFAAISVVLGTAMTFVARQQIAIAQFHKSSERERIARDLHDILGHTLSVIILKSELASRMLESNPQRAKSEIEDVERISRSALKEVREAISGYRFGDLLEEFGRAQSTLKTAGLAVEHDYRVSALSVAQERVLALAMREGVTNILRHAHATRCRVTVMTTDNACRLEIRDDGRGGEHREGMGMRGIRERVRAIGGFASWRSDAGTTLTIEIPLVNPREALDA